MGRSRDGRRAGRVMDVIQVVRCRVSSGPVSCISATRWEYLMSVNEMNMPHPENANDTGIVTVYVNGHPVPLDKNPIAPLDIEYAARDSGVNIDPPCPINEDGKDLNLHELIPVQGGEKFYTMPFFVE